MRPSEMRELLSFIKSPDFLELPPNEREKIVYILLGGRGAVNRSSCFKDSAFDHSELLPQNPWSGYDTLLKLNIMAECSKKGLCFLTTANCPIYNANISSGSKAQRRNISCNFLRSLYKTGENGSVKSVVMHSGLLEPAIYIKNFIEFLSLNNREPCSTFITYLSEMQASIGELL